jgi:cytochrome P450
MSVTTNPRTGLPTALPVIGHAHHLLRNPWDFFAAIRPLGDIVKVRIGPTPTYILNSPDLIRQVMVVETRKYDKGVQFDKLRPILGNGLVTAAGEEHRRNRRLVQPAFHHARIAGYAEIMRALSVQAADSWTDGQRLEIDRELPQLTMKIVGKALFSTDLGTEVVDEVVRSMPIVLSGITKRAVSPIALLEKLPTPGNLRFNAAIERLKSTVDRFIADYRAGGVDHGDMVSMLLMARDAETGEGLPDEQVRDEVITMLLAGTETTANLLAWTLHVLGEFPGVEARLQAEVDEVLGDGELSFADIGRLAYTRRVITETLRMFPPAWLNTRRAAEDVELGGLRLPKGTSIMFSPYSLQREERFFADPESFDPDRWLPERAKEIPRPAFIPFGAGNRQCIGEGFAWTEAIIVLATIVRRWRLTPVPGREVRRVPGATLTPSQLPMIAHARVDRPAAERARVLAMAS